MMTQHPSRAETASSSIHQTHHRPLRSSHGAAGKTTILYKLKTLHLSTMVDRSDRDRVRLATDELAALLVLAKKQDLPNAMRRAEMSEELGLHQSFSLAL